LVESINGIDGMPPTSNFVVVASNFVEVEMQQLAIIQAIAWKPHN
jgi:hypothetical protein